MAESSKPNGDAPLRLKKFNSTGSQTTTEVLVTQVSPEDKLRRIALIAVVVVAFGVLGAIAFSRSHLNPFEQQHQGPGFTPPARSVPGD